MVRIGVIGAGRVAQIAHLATFSQLPGATITALADLRPELATLVAQRWNIPRVYADHRELLADPNVDAVVVVVQRSQTAAIVAAALRAGKHVLSEKPMALSTADATRLVEIAGAQNLVYAIGYMKRHDRGVAIAREKIMGWRASGAMGELLVIKADHDGGDDCAGSDWLMTPEARTDLGFTVTAAVGDATSKSAFDRFLNVFSHTTNLVRYVTGGPLAFTLAEQTADRAVVGGPGADAAPFLGSLTENHTTGWHERIRVLFEGVVISIDAPPPFDRTASATIRASFNDSANSLEDWSLPGWAFARQAEAFVHDVAHGAEPLAPGHDSVADVVLGEAFWRLSKP